MWSLYEIEEGKESKERFLSPLVFSNNKSQEDVVKEIIGAINEGWKIIFIKGVCGTGKSAIALNLAKELGRASIVVPIKALQKQYENDYTKKKYLLKENKQKLRISLITGRKNHLCPFLQEKQEQGKKEKKEENAKLSEFDNNLTDLSEFDSNLTDTENNEDYKTRREVEENIRDISCDNYEIPCKIEIKEKNLKKIKEYIRLNKFVLMKNFNKISDVKRMSIAPVCPYWSPILPSWMNIDVLKNESRYRKYTGLHNIEYTIYKRKQGCGYYDQFDAYVDADVIIFNSKKYLLETVMDRKPSTDIEIIDECDDFLDSFANQSRINLNRLEIALANLYPDSETEKPVSELRVLVKNILNNREIEEHILNEKIFPLEKTKISLLLKYFLDNPKLLEAAEEDEQNYCYHCDEVARTFDGLFDETYLTYQKEEDSLIVKLVTINLAKKFKELQEKNKVLVLMSGTIHSRKVLKDIFGIENFKIIEAETEMPGKAIRFPRGIEMNCKFENFLRGRINRRDYLLALSKCIEKAKKPILVHVNSFADLPSEEECKLYNIKNIMTREKLLSLQEKDKTGKAVEHFKKGKIDILFTTKCNRGADFPGNQCNSIILTKYPYPNISSLFWRILKRTRPKHYREFYMDKSKRELLQRIYRGLRSEEDCIFLLSPDIRVLRDNLR